MSQDKNNILVVGSVAFDSVETPAGGVDKALGGSATFASIAASYFAAPRVVGVVGEDFGDEHFQPMVTHGVDTDGIEQVPGNTFHWKGRYHDNMQDRDTLATHLNVFENFDPKVPEVYRQSPYVFLGNIAPSIQMKVLDQVENSKFVGMDTMNFWIDSALDDLRAVLMRIDMLFINDEEASQLSGERQVLNAAEKILEMGPRYVVIKRGEFGSLLFGEGFCLFVPAVLLPKVIDPTGAGDAFAGGFVGSLARAGDMTRGTLAHSMIDGTVMASFAVGKFSVDGLINLSDDAVKLRRAFLESMTDYC